MNSIKINPPTVKRERKGFRIYTKITLTAPTNQRRRVNSCARDRQFGLGHIGGCKGRSDVGRMFRREVCGGQTEWKGKKPKYDGNGCGKDPGNRGGGWFSGSGREGNIGGKGDGCVVGRDGGARRAIPNFFYTTITTTRPIVFIFTTNHFNPTCTRHWCKSTITTWASSSNSPTRFATKWIYTGFTIVSNITTTSSFFFSFSPPIISTPTVPETFRCLPWWILKFLMLHKNQFWSTPPAHDMDFDEPI